MLNYGTEKLRRIIFSDEFRVSLDKIGGKESYISREYKPHLNLKKTGYAKKRMFWCCFSMEAMGPIITIDGILSGND